MNFIPLASWSITSASRFVFDAVTVKTEKRRKSICYNFTVFSLVEELHTLIDIRDQKNEKEMPVISTLEMMPIKIALGPLRVQM